MRILPFVLFLVASLCHPDPAGASAGRVGGDGNTDSKAALEVAQVSTERNPESGDPLTLAGHRKAAEQEKVVAQGNRASAESILDGAKPSARLSVLILGDSMSLCGFGKRLDYRFRNTQRVKSTFTYMACGANPLSWTKEAPFTNIRTFCGFWSIESVAGATQPREFQDTYATKSGALPAAHTIPKLEDLLSRIHPDILIVQSDTNLLSLFRDGDTLLPRLHGRLLRNHIAPFMAKALDGPGAVQKVYWVGAPTSARVSDKIQQFVLEQIRAEASSAVTVIDSRGLVGNAHGNMEVDNEHFVGVEMTEWADKVFAIIARDLVTLSRATPVPRKSPERSPESDPKSVDMGRTVTQLRGKLAFKSQPLQVNELLPYQESLVAYVYDVVGVLEGTYLQKRVLVMHPAHIRLKRQPLDKYQLGGLYELRLSPLEGTPWQTIKARDESGIVDLEPYIQVEDEARFPGLASPRS